MLSTSGFSWVQLRPGELHWLRRQEVILRQTPTHPRPSLHLCDLERCFRKFRVAWRASSITLGAQHADNCCIIVGTDMFHLVMCSTTSYGIMLLLQETPAAKQELSHHISREARQQPGCYQTSRTGVGKCGCWLLEPCLFSNHQCNYRLSLAEDTWSRQQWGKLR